MAASVPDKIQNRRDIITAFEQYLTLPDISSVNRLATLSRLANVEFELAMLIQENAQDTYGSIDTEPLFLAQIDKAIHLYNVILNDYPRFERNDEVLYQIARLQYLKDDYISSHQTLQKLVNTYKDSTFYNEAQFRIAENYYADQSYELAEKSYTVVINSKLNSEFYEKSLFKRGWCKLKMQQYQFAIDDYIAAIVSHNFGNIKKLSPSDSDQFKEYFRAIGISFSYINDISLLEQAFSRHPDFNYISYTYSVISDLYRQQQRYTDATDVINKFISTYPLSNDAPMAHLKMIEILQEAGFINSVNSEIEHFYSLYQPDSKYWQKHQKDAELVKTVHDSLRHYSLLSTAYFHNKYQTTKYESDFNQAKKWYLRFLNNHKTHARRANIHYLYAELLSEHGDYEEAINYYEIAAYDKGLVLNKDAAYATIVLSNKLYVSSSNQQTKETWLDKHLHYALTFYRMYPDHEQANKTVMHATELAYSNGKYEKSIELAELITSSEPGPLTFKLDTIRAPAYFNIGNYSAAENVYTSLIKQSNNNPSEVKKYQDSLALSIYKQAEDNIAKGNIDVAAHHYLRISKLAGTSELASTAMYDAIALFMKHSRWHSAINTIKHFQDLYPNHKYINESTKKLSIAYLNSNQELKAAKEFEKISDFEQEIEVKMSALWQAALIYEEKNHLNDAITSFQKYVNTYSKPYPQYLEAMNKISSLYLQSGNIELSSHWKNKIVFVDKETPPEVKTDRTRLIASTANLELARIAFYEFKNIQLTQPLKLHLTNKKAAMKKAVLLYGQSSSYGIEDIITEATYSIAEIYNLFSKSLLRSERPANLTDEQLEQYEILLEDQAYPFEEKAIEFYETNLAHTKSGVFNRWINLSLVQLEEMFPTRYMRQEKTEKYINVIH